MSRGGELVGRGEELAAIRAFLDGGTARLLVVAGEAGIGKTAVWDAAVEGARRLGETVLLAAPAESEVSLAFAALGDLLQETLGEVRRLPALRRRALEVALILTESDTDNPDRRSVALALLDVLNLIAGERPVLVAIDDAQWLDAPSALALGFALRRCDPARVRALVTVRDGAALPPPLEPLERATIPIGPITMGATRQLVLDRLGTALARPALRRLYERSHGNPLHALELARALRTPHLATAPDAFEAPHDLAELVRLRLAEVPEGVRFPLVVVAAMSRPTLELVRRACPGAEAALLESGLLSVAGGRVRFAHPLYATVCYGEAGLGARKAAHALIAETVTDVVDRARHLALAASGPSEQVAAVLDEAARRACARGAPDAAAELGELARRLTPRDDRDALVRRADDAARYLLGAGDAVLARAALEAAVELAPPGATRARARLALAHVLYEADGANAAAAAAQTALAEAGDDELLRAEALLAAATLSTKPVHERLELLRPALAVVTRDDRADPRAVVRGLCEAAVSSFHLGGGVDRAMLARADALERRLPVRPPVAWRARTIEGECLKYVDEFADADALLAEAQEQAESEADEGSLAEILGHRAELALWLGRWDDAARLSEAGVAAAERTAVHGRIAIATYFRALVRAHRGDLEGAQDDAERALVHAMRDNRWPGSLARWTLGFVALSAGDAAAATAQLDETDALLAGDILSETRQWRYLPDYVEALVANGELDRARDRVERLEAWAATVGTRSTAALAARGRGVLLDASGERDAGLAALAEACAAFADLPLPFERARTLLALGGALRRARRRREARAALDDAVAIFDRLGASAWLERARAELSRIGGRAPSGDALTPSERRVAELVAAGRSNKEIAAALVVAQRTVEAHLTRVYAKLGVQSRTELARILS